MNELIKKLEEEKEQLTIKINKLTQFRSCEENKDKVSKNGWFLLGIQLDIMKAYAQVLTTRIVDLLPDNQ